MKKETEREQKQPGVMRVMAWSELAVRNNTIWFDASEKNSEKKWKETWKCNAKNKNKKKYSLVSVWLTEKMQYLVEPGLFDCQLHR